MDASAETAAAQSADLPDLNALYCEECLRVDQSFNDIPNSVTEQEDLWSAILPLKANLGSIKEDTDCPSCRGLLILFDRETEHINLLLEGYDLAVPKQGILSAVRIEALTTNTRIIPDVDVYLFPRQNYPTRLRKTSPTPNKASNLPIELIKPWLQTCEREHESCQPDPAQRLTISLYLIDIVEECVTFMPATNVRYVALSYVWGDVKFTKLTSENMEALAKPRSLSSGSHIATIPRTIRDAMRFTADLEIGYLWVDSLCIRQGDPNVGIYLSQMHCIYHNAFMTIVVANRDNADGGITGYEPCSAGRMLPGNLIEYPNYVLGIEDLHSASTEPPWTSRGWTLQEGFFSRRALVVTDDISLVCAKNTAKEGGDFGYSYTREPQKSVSLAYVCQSNDADFRLDTYPIVVEAYAYREFSYETDVMKAFSGIVSFFTRPDESEPELNVDLLYGHPVFIFTISLLWKSLAYNLRRRNLQPRQDGSPTIPSWSWMAWQHSFYSTLGRHMSDCFVTNTNDLDPPTVIYAQFGTCMQKHKMTREACNIGDARERVDPECLDPYLQIGAQRAVFHAQLDQQVDEYILVQTQTIQNGVHNIIGSITFDHQSSELDGNIVRTFEFVGMYLAMNRSSVTGVAALCVKPVDNRPGVFERLGTAEIEKDAWDQVARFDGNIILG